MIRSGGVYGDTKGKRGQAGFVLRDEAWWRAKPGELELKLIRQKCISFLNMFPLRPDNTLIDISTI